MNDVSEAFGDFLESVSITRSATGSYIEGVWIPGSTSSVSINAVVQNVQPDDMRVLEEGMRTSEAIKLHSTADLIPLSEADKTVGDIIAYQGFNWQVVNVARRFIGNYNKAIAIRIPS